MDDKNKEEKETKRKREIDNYLPSRASSQSSLAGNKNSMNKKIK